MEKPTPSRSLRLRRETLTELNADEMAAIRGGNNITIKCFTGTETYGCPTLPVGNCDFTNSCWTGNYSLNPNC
jgi:hypothetical protein